MADSCKPTSKASLSLEELVDKQERYCKQEKHKMINKNKTA